MKSPNASSGVSLNGKSIIGALPQNPLLAREPKVLASSPPQAARYSGFFRIKRTKSNMLDLLKHAGLAKSAHFNKFNVLGFLLFEQHQNGLEVHAMAGLILMDHFKRRDTCNTDI
jgi:hypothetical protein